MSLIYFTLNSKDAEKISQQKNHTNSTKVFLRRPTPTQETIYISCLFAYFCESCRQWRREGMFKSKFLSSCHNGSLAIFSLLLMQWNVIKFTWTNQIMLQLPRGHHLCNPNYHPLIYSTNLGQKKTFFSSQVKNV